MKEYMVFDIGGTNIKYGILKEDYSFSFHDAMPTDGKQGGHQIMERIIGKTLEYRDRVAGVAISSAGIIDPNCGKVIHTTGTIPGYTGLPIKAIVEEKTNLPCEVLNDVKCFALAEHMLGSARGTKDSITLTIGTGIGGAIIANGQLIYGKDFSAGEWGRIMINGEQFEALASITGLIRHANELIGPNDWNGVNIFKLYDAGHQQAKEAVDRFYSYLAIGISNLIYIFNPEKVVIGGGITARGNKFLNELKDAIQRVIEPFFFERTEIVLSKFQNQSGMIGALIHFQQKQSHEENSAI